MRGIAGWIFLIVLGLVGVKACSSHGTSSETSSRQSHIVTRAEKIADGEVAVAAGKSVYYRLDIRPDMLEPVIKGNFEASGGSGNDIVAAIADEANYINWANGHTSQVLWQTDGQQTVGNFEVKLTPGTYYLGISNRFSAISDKRVALRVNLSYKQEE